MSLTQLGERLELRSEVEIEVAAAALWTALFDLNRLARWNPFWAGVKGTIAMGSRVTLELAPPGGKTLRLHRTIRVFDPHRELVWEGRYGWGWLLRSDQFFRFAELDSQKTRLTVGENLRGPGVTGNHPTVLDIARGQALMNQALKRYIESSKR